MTRTSEFIVNYLLNATWQIPFIALYALICTRLLSKARAHYLHALWVLSLVLCFVLPIWSVVNITGESTNTIKDGAVKSGAAQTPLTVAGNLSPAPAVDIRTGATASPSRTHIFRNRAQAAIADPQLFMVPALVFACFVFYRMSRLWISWRRTQSLRRSIFRCKL